MSTAITRLSSVEGTLRKHLSPSETALARLLDLPAIETDAARGRLQVTPGRPEQREIPSYLMDRLLALADGDPEVVALFDLAAKKAGLKSRADLASLVKICGIGITTDKVVCVQHDSSLAVFYSIVVHELVHYVGFDDMQKGLTEKDILSYKTPEAYLREALRAKGGELEGYSKHGRAYLRLRARFGYRELAPGRSFSGLPGFNTLPEGTFDPEGNLLRPEVLLEDIVPAHLWLFEHRLKVEYKNAKAAQDFYADLIAKGKKHPSYPGKLKEATERVQALERQFGEHLPGKKKSEPVIAPVETIPAKNRRD